MKENRKLLKEVLKDIRRDMTDEEVLNLLADSKISGVRSVSVYFAESGAVLHCSDPGAAHHDEPEPSGGKGSPQSRKRL